MALNSVDPNNIKPEMPGMSGSDSGMMKPPQTPIPSPNPMNSSDLGFNQLSKYTKEGDEKIAAAAKSSGGGGGGIFGSILGAVGPIAGLFSDRRLKENVHEVGQLNNGLPVYNYHYKGSDTGQIGLMADEVQGKHPEAVGESSGYKTVNYDKATKMADGGMVGQGQGQGQGSEDGMIAGYLIGALHQQKYGGTPDTIQQAAEEIRGMMDSQQDPEMQMAAEIGSNTPASGSSATLNADKIVREDPSYPKGAAAKLGNAFGVTNDLRNELRQKGLKGFADGGMADNPQNNPNQALMNALGLGSSDMANGALNAPQAAQPANAQNNQQGMDQNNQNVMNQMNQPTGLADNPDQMGEKGYAMGGVPGMPPQMPPQAQQGMMNKPAMGVPGTPPMGPQQAPMAPQGMMRPQPQMQKPMQPQQNPAMRGFADGGMNMPPGQEQAPLAPGQAFQGEGEVKGPGGPQDDMIPAKLSNGEFVMSQPATAFFGVDKLIKMNEQGKQGFMQAKQQVDMNQPQQGGGAPPMAAPPGGAGPGMMMPPPPMPQEGMAKGGAAVMRSKGSGYCGM